MPHGPWVVLPLTLVAVRPVRRDPPSDRVAQAEAAAIGFCDDELYCELNRHFSARRIVMEHHPMPDALLPLRHWANNPARTPY